MSFVTILSPGTSSTSVGRAREHTAFDHPPCPAAPRTRPRLSPLLLPTGALVWGNSSDTPSANNMAKKKGGKKGGKKKKGPAIFTADEDVAPFGLRFNDIVSTPMGLTCTVAGVKYDNADTKVSRRPLRCRAEFGRPAATYPRDGASAERCAASRRGRHTHLHMPPRARWWRASRRTAREDAGLVVLRCQLGWDAVRPRSLALPRPCARSSTSNGASAALGRGWRSRLPQKGPGGAHFRALCAGRASPPLAGGTRPRGTSTKGRAISP